MLPVRILLLEDDTQLRTALGQVLELEGYQVVTAADGAEAVEKAQRCREYGLFRTSVQSSSCKQDDHRS